MRVAYLCGGCGKRIEAATAKQLGPMPPGWLATPRDHYPLAHRGIYDYLNGTIVACSADCVREAKENAKKYWRDWSERQMQIIDAAKLAPATVERP